MDMDIEKLTNKLDKKIKELEQLTKNNEERLQKWEAYSARLNAYKKAFKALQDCLSIEDYKNELQLLGKSLLYQRYTLQMEISNLIEKKKKKFQITEEKCKELNKLLSILLKYLKGLVL